MTARAAPDGASRWEDACRAAAMLAVAPELIGGIWVIGRAGPVRAAWLAACAERAGPFTRIPTGVTIDRLSGGLDLSATLAAGRPVHSAGLLETGRPLVLPMAERIEQGAAALIGQALDQGAAAVALDERAEPEEALPSLLADRLGPVVVLDGLSQGDCLAPMMEPDEIAAARQASPSVTISDRRRQDLAATAIAFGAGQRAMLFADAAARVSAAIGGRQRVGEADLATALRLVIAPRATKLPEAEADPAPPDPPPPDQSESEAEAQNADPAEADLPEDILAEATRAAMPEAVLTALLAGETLRGGGRGGRGAERQAALRGRPAGIRPGYPGGGLRLDIAATLRTAAPWQRLRGRAPGQPLAIRAEDFRVIRYRERAETLTIFAVDASGSAAIARLAEAKGAVEIMLAEAYRRRDHVAVIGFRGEGAELLLPPTRALARAKRALGGLPGGGGTPLAAGLAEALSLAEQARRRGQSTALVVLTDGRANVPLAPEAPRAQAQEDADHVARAIRAAGLAALMVDTSRRPRPEAEALATAMGARYLPMPQAEPGALVTALEG